MRVLFHRKLDGVHRSFGAQVVHARFQALLPGVEVHGRELAEIGIFYKQVHALALANVRAPVGGHVYDGLLAQFPHRAVQHFDVLGYAGYVLHRTIGGHQAVFHLFVPQAQSDEVFQQVFVHDDELAGEGAPTVNVGGIRLEALVVAQYLRGRSGGHGRQQEAVAQSVPGYVGLQRAPVEAVRGRHVPHVVLQDALTCRRTGIALVGTVLRGLCAGFLQRAVVDGLEDVAVEGAGLVAVERHAHQQEGVGQSLHADADGAVAEIAVAGFRYGVVVDVNDAVEVARHHAGDVHQALEVETAVFAHELGEVDGGQVAHGHFVGRGVFHDLRAEVAGADGAEVFLVRLLVGGVFVEDVGRAGFDLRFEDGKPEFLRFYGFAGAAFLLVAVVESFKLAAVAVVQAGCFVRTEERPFGVGFHALHEEVGYPHGVEEVAGAEFFLAVVFLQVEIIEDVGMPRFQIDGESAFPAATALIHVAGRIVEHLQHRDDAVGGAVGAFDVAACGADVVDAETDAAGALTDEGAALQGFKNALDGVFRHAQKKARTQLRLRRARIEEGRGGVYEPLFRHEVVGLDGGFYVFAVYAHGHAQQHLLGALHHFAVHFQQVGAFEGFEPEVVKLVVAVVDDGRVKFVAVFPDHGKGFVADEACFFAGFGINVVVEFLHRAGEGLVGIFVQVRHRNAGSQLRVVGVYGGHGRGGFGGEVVQLGGAHAGVQALNDFFGDFDVVHVLRVQPVAQFFYSCGDFVKADFFLFAAAF